MNIGFFYYGKKDAGNIQDHLDAFLKYSKNNIIYINTLTQSITLEEANQFDVIVIHYTIAIFSDSHLPSWLRLVLRQTKAKKAIFIQDEYRVINEIHQNLLYLKIDLLFTCIPIPEIENVYPTSKLPDLKKVYTLTGFVPENLLNRHLPSYEDRPLDVVYRARKLSSWYGRLGREKWKIAELFLSDSARYSLKTNISYHEKDRMYGEDWIRFLQNAKAALGTESGSSVFDFSGEIAHNVETYERVHPAASFEEIEEKFFKGLDGKIRMNMISPRCFECAALGTLMILYEGEYSGILTAWHHYLPLKKDHSNMQEIVEYVKDPLKWEKITKQAYKEIALNPKYSYQAFIQHFDEQMVGLMSGAFPKFQNTSKLQISQTALNNFLLPLSKNKLFLFNESIVKGLIKLTKLLPKRYWLAAEKSINALNQYATLVVRLIRDLLKSGQYSGFLSLANRNLYREYIFLHHLRKYIQDTKKMAELNVVSIFSNHPTEVVIYLDPDTSHLHKAPDFSLIQPAHTLRCIGANSLGVSQEMRGRTVDLHYPILARYILTQP